MRLGFVLTGLLALLAWQFHALQPTEAGVSAQRPVVVKIPHDGFPRCTDQVPDSRDFGLRAWPRTDFCRHTVVYEEITGTGVPRERIPAIDQPVFQAIAEADLWLHDVEPVIALQLNGDVRAYPLQVLVWHEIVNDTVGGQAVVVTYCPLCSSALVFLRAVDGQVLDFAVSGNLLNSNLILYDRQTESWWQQFTGEAIIGTFAGTQLQPLSADLVSWADFKRQFPAARVLFPDTGYERIYGETPYLGYDSLTHRGARFFSGTLDQRLPPKMRVLGLDLGDLSIAYPYAVLSELGVINDVQAGRELAVFWKSGTASALYKKVIAESKDVGSAAAFSRVLNGQVLTFVPAGAAFKDRETGSTWNLFGAATAGPLAGQRLTPLKGHEVLWFAWAAFRPQTRLFALP